MARTGSTNQFTKGADKRMSEQQQLFVDHFLRFGNATDSARHAGYAHPESAANKLLSKPHIKRYCQQHIAATALGHVPDMIDVLASIAVDNQQMAKDRIAAATAIVDRAGIPNGKQGTNINIDNSTKQVNIGGAEVAKLIAETWQRGRGQIENTAPEQLQIAGPQEEIEDAEIDEDDGLE